MGTRTSSVTAVTTPASTSVSTSVSADRSHSRIEGSREDEVLDATLEVLVQVGYDRLTMDAVASAARAGKASLYRRWGSKSDLVVDAISLAHRRGGVLNPHDTGSLRGDLVAMVGDASFAHARLTGVMAGVLTALQRDEDLRQSLVERVIGPRMRATRAVFERSQARGEVHPAADLDILVDILFSMFALRAVLNGLPPDQTSTIRLIDQVVLPAAAASPHPPPPETLRTPPETRRTPPETRRTRPETRRTPPAARRTPAPSRRPG